MELKHWFAVLGVSTVFMAGTAAQAATMPTYSQNFEGFPLGGGVSSCGATTAALAGLCYTNRSTTVGDNWGGGNTNVFAAQSGTAGSYLADSYLAGGPTGVVSDWLLTPTLTIGNGYTFSFYARGADDSPGTPDRLQLRMSTNGTSVNVGTTPTAVGDFTTLMLSINPTLAAGGFPTVWTQYTATVSGLTGLTSGRFGLRYFLDDASTQGDYIGIDGLLVTAVPEPETVGLLALGLSAIALSRRRPSRPSLRTSFVAA